MYKKKDKIILIAVIISVGVTLYFVPKENSYFGIILEQFSEPEWEKISDRNIVKNAIPITLIEKNDRICKVSAQKFDIIVDHEYFKRGDELAEKLHYDRTNQTIMLSCDMLKGEKSKLNIWYILEESPKHAKKYQYFITEWNSTMTG